MLAGGLKRRSRRAKATATLTRLKLIATPHLDDIKNARCIHPEDNEEAREHTAPDAQDTTPCL